MAGFVLNICGAPYTSQAPLSALRFARAALAAGHQIQRVFFYQDGVLLANALTCPPQDETHLTREWQQLAANHQLELLVCVAAALRRGILDQKEAARHGLAHHNLAEGFTLAGLGQLVDGMSSTDRLMTFSG
ncbi:sulfurtransferase complex subunit TusD [Marinospirillum alkaliphilum]|uniref:tRNA 2-thiouridine synthesizing protein D n=1 Tax=Marinospirillum alkaliphilum DSM 21637 TaxID=1122209 RepID=A0A1K1TV71_9GAMM|nr:sulfurtransferase complex subunit TusD [Marinospirillum alkaliphilum]SFX04424.1 tRNA 2-thiouridine synthesizing protein D [Marinospirillum alkaliphilum DSM 21637]